MSADPVVPLLELPMRSALFCLAVAASLASPPLHAADVYRWVDELGRVHFSDSVPDRYRDQATKLDTRPSELSDAQRKEAEARAVQAQVQAAEAAAAKARATPAAALSVPMAKASAPAPKATDCATLHRLYQESLDCFGPYRTVHGTTKAEAFDKCSVVADPTPQCGAAPRRQP